MKKLISILFCNLLLLSLGFTSCENPQPDGGNDMPGTETGTGSLMGCVTDFATGEPVPNANVQLRPTGETALTGNDGMYAFYDIKEGNYSITVSKAEYTDLIDDYVISVKKGRNMRRDVQIEKIPTYIRFTDMQGNDISKLDFNTNSSIDMLSFNIYNNGTVKIDCEVLYSCSWITSVSPSNCTLLPGKNIIVVVKIDRSKLAIGENVTKLYISSNNGSNVIDVVANSYAGNPPTLQIFSAEMITATSAQVSAQIVNTNNGIISDCGFYYGTSPSPDQYDKVVNLGPSTGKFTFLLKELKAGTRYYVRAFSESNLGIGYSSDITFTTASGIPTCGRTYISNLDPTSAIGESTAYSNDGCEIIESGLCWSTYSSPTTSNQTITHYGPMEGAIGGMLYPLKPNTQYYVRSYAKSEFGISYGPEMTFTSMSGLATVTTSSARLIGDEIKTGGYVYDDAGTIILHSGVCYGFSPNPDTSYRFEHTDEGFDTGSFTSYITKPYGSGYLYIRAYATTKYGTSYGEQVKIYIQ